MFKLWPFSSRLKLRKRGSSEGGGDGTASAPVDLAGSDEDEGEENAPVVPHEPEAVEEEGGVACPMCGSRVEGGEAKLAAHVASDCSFGSQPDPSPPAPARNPLCDERSAYACAGCGEDLSGASAAARVAHLKACEAARDRGKKRPRGTILGHFAPADPAMSAELEEVRTVEETVATKRRWRGILSGLAGGGVVTKASRPAAKRRRGGGGGAAGGGGGYPCPLHRLIRTGGQRPPFIVDGFSCRPGRTKAFFLSHAHSDHYGGLSSSWRAGTIYCTAVTAALMRRMFPGVAERLVALPLGRRVQVDGVGVQLVDANHCPGAVLFVFDAPTPSGRAARREENRRYVVHCGDMRYHPGMRDDPFLRSVAGRVDALHLDTTYCDPKHDFPPQAESVAFVVARAREAIAEGGGGAPAAADFFKPRTGAAAPSLARMTPGAGGQMRFRPCKTLVLVGTYSIGKERVLLEVARQCEVMVGVSSAHLERLRLLRLFSDDPAADASAFRRVFTTSVAAAPVHAVPMGTVSLDAAAEYMRQVNRRHGTGYKRVLAFRPTGWSGNRPRTSQRGPATVHHVPYSEHSSFRELRDFVAFLRPRRVVPTVNAANRERRAEMIAHFDDLLEGSSSSSSSASAPPCQ